MDNNYKYAIKSEEYNRILKKRVKKCKVNSKDLEDLKTLKIGSKTPIEKLTKFGGL